MTPVVFELTGLGGAATIERLRGSLGGAGFDHRYPTMAYLRLSFALGFLLLVCAGTVLQARFLPPPSGISNADQAVRAQTVSKELAAARELLAAGRVDEALLATDKVLRSDPAHRDAALVKITALLKQGDFHRALSAYDDYITAAKTPDMDLLSRLAHADLEQLRRESQAGDGLAIAALERLAHNGDATALEALRRHAAEGTGRAGSSAVPPALLSLSRLGDKDARERLGALLDSAPPDQRADLIRMIQDAGARDQAPRLLPLLRDAQPQVRAAAARALGAFKATDAVARLEELFRDDVAVVRMFAGVALRQLGRTTADEYLAGLLAKGLPEVRLIAAEAYQGSDAKRWIAPLKELLRDRNEVARLRAAELLACCDPPSARTALLAALDSQNPLLRREAARILETTGLGDARVLRRLLGDPADAVRVHADGAVLQSAGATRKAGR